MANNEVDLNHPLLVVEWKAARGSCRRVACVTPSNSKPITVILMNLRALYFDHDDDDDQEVGESTGCVSGISTKFSVGPQTPVVMARTSGV